MYWTKISFVILIETLADTKNKLSLQKEIYEDQFNKVKDVLEIPKETGSFDEVLQGIKGLKESEMTLREKAEIGLYSRAEDVIKTQVFDFKE